MKADADANRTIIMQSIKDNVLFPIIRKGYRQMKKSLLARKELSRLTAFPGKVSSCLFQFSAPHNNSCIRVKLHESVKDSPKGHNLVFLISLR